MRSLRSARGHSRPGRTGALAARGLLAGLSVLAAACSSAAPPQTFHPAGDPASATSAPAPAARRTAQGLAMPPFGPKAHAVMTPWHPGSKRGAAAVLAAKDFLLAVLYADYTGGQDHRWTRYVGSARVRAGLGSTLAAPGVTTESFTGTIRFWRMFAVWAATDKSKINVTECVDSAGARNTALATGKVLPHRQQVPRDQNYYSNTDELARTRSGHWRVISIPPDVYYPEARQCKP